MAAKRNNEVHRAGVKRAANSPEGKAIRSANLRRLWATPEFREMQRRKRIRMNQERKGVYKHSPETRLKMRLAHRKAAKPKSEPAKLEPAKLDDYQREVLRLWGE